MSHKNTLVEIRNELVQAFNNGELIEYISSNTVEIKKDEDGDLSQIVFTIGGPYIYPDFKERSGVICGYNGISDDGYFSAIPYLQWESIRDELEGLF